MQGRSTTRENSGLGRNDYEDVQEVIDLDGGNEYKEGRLSGQEKVRVH